MSGSVRPELRVYLEWQATPLWTLPAGGGMDNPPSASLVSAPLVAELDAWSQEYDGHWDPDDPRGPRFPDRDSELAFFARGRALAVRVAAEVGDRYAVRFQDADGAWEQLSG